MPELTRGRDIWKSLLGLFVLVGVLALIAHYIDIEALRGEIERAGWWAPLILIALKASTIVIAPLGGSPLYPIAGALFDFWEAVFYLVLGDILGGAISFYLSRYFGRALVERMLGSDPGLITNALYMMSTVRGFFIARLCFITFPELASYAAGLSRLHFLPFIVIFAGVGVVPTLFGVSLGALIIGGGNTFWLAGLAVALSLVTLCGIALFGYLANRHDISAVESAKDSSEEYADR